jgi:CYTH domain-containing protein
MPELEQEQTFLAKSLPSGLSSLPNKEIIDMYIPAGSPHAHLRIRKNGDKYVITKKVQLDPQDATTHHEHNIELDEAEFTSFKDIPSRRLSKIRYFYPYKGKTAEIDVFTGKLTGLVLVDFEFSSLAEMKSFVVPDFCLVDVTQEEFVAGGILAGMNYADIADDLARFNYKPIPHVG